MVNELERKLPLTVLMMQGVGLGDAVEEAVVYLLKSILYMEQIATTKRN